MRLQLGTRGSLSWPRRPNITYVDVREQYIYGRLGGRDPLAHGTEQDAELDILIIPYTPTETTEWNQVVPAFLLLKNCEMDHGYMCCLATTTQPARTRRGDMQSLETCPIQLERKKRGKIKGKEREGRAGRSVGACAALLSCA